MDRRHKQKPIMCHVLQGFAALSWSNSAFFCIHLRPGGIWNDVTYESLWLAASVWCHCQLARLLLELRWSSHGDKMKDLKGFCFLCWMVHAQRGHIECFHLFSAMCVIQGDFNSLRLSECSWEQGTFCTPFVCQHNESASKREVKVPSHQVLPRPFVDKAQSPLCANLKRVWPSYAHLNGVVETLANFLWNANCTAAKRVKNQVSLTIFLFTWSIPNSARPFKKKKMKKKPFG